MSGNDKKTENAKAIKDADKSRKTPPTVVEGDDIEDGDFATPKRDRDDEQGL